MTTAIQINASLKNVCFMAILAAIADPKTNDRKRQILRAEVKRRETIALAAFDA